MGENLPKIEVRVTGFETKKQAEVFISWYEGQGEQDSEIWLQEHAGYSTLVDVTKKLVWDGNTIEMPLKMMK